MKKIIFYLSTAILGLILPLQASYTQGYRIETNIKGAEDTPLILSYRYGQKFFSLDTIHTNNEGFAVFEDTLDISRGMYQIILPDKKFFDFFIDETSFLSISTDKQNLVEYLNSEDNKGNQLFFDWQRKNKNLREEATELQAKMNSAQGGGAGDGEYKSQLASLREENKNLWDEYINKLGDNLAGKFLKGVRPFEVPKEVYQKPGGEIDQAAQYEYYKNNFFEFIDFSDPALIRTPLIFSKLDQFFTKVVPAIADSVIYHVDKVIGLTETSPEMFQFTVQYLLNQFSDPKIMGLDAVYVYIAENYYLTGKAIWVDEKNLKLIKDRVKVLKPLLIGQPAPILTGLETPEGEGIDIKDIEASFILLYFWEPDCSFCKTSTPQLMKIFKDYEEKGIRAVAINTRLEKEPWEKFIAEHELTWINVNSPNNMRAVLSDYEAYSTPKLFILDSNKKIVAKDIAVDQCPQILDYLLKMK